MIKYKHNKSTNQSTDKKALHIFCWQHYMGVTLNHSSANIDTMNYRKDMAATPSKKETT
jgi:hypothetical protein